MPKLIAVVTAEDATLDKLAAFLRYALAPGPEHVYSEDGPTLANGTIYVTDLEIRHPDGEHYRDKATGRFASPEDEAERPGEIEHETGDTGHRPEPKRADLGDDPDGDVDGYDGAGAR